MFYPLPPPPHHHLKYTYFGKFYTHTFATFKFLELFSQQSTRVLKRDGLRRQARRGMRSEMFVCLFWVEEDGRRGPTFLPSQQSEKYELRGHGDRGKPKAWLFPGRRSPCGWL